MTREEISELIGPDNLFKLEAHGLMVVQRELNYDKMRVQIMDRHSVMLDFLADAEKATNTKPAKE